MFRDGSRRAPLSRIPRVPPYRRSAILTPSPEAAVLPTLPSREPRATAEAAVRLVEATPIWTVGTPTGSLLSPEQFVTQLKESGLLPAQELNDLLAGLPGTPTVDALSEQLVRSGKLTRFQASKVAQGKAKSLILGNYTVVDKIGQGGMGLVVKARHRVMNRVVAIKVLSNATVRSPDALKRFHREVEAAARLNHAHIVAAFDADQANGTHFLVMEYVDGYDLASLVRQQGPLSIKRTLECLLQAGRGLEFAHAQGVVHRDIKPANLLVDRAGLVKILDLGLARLDGGEQRTDLTSSGQIMGTVDFMAPEQALNTRTADQRADIYSFGCTLYYLLTGRMVYSGETAMEKLLAHRESPIPSLMGMRSELHPTNPQAVALEAIVQKMLAKRPAQRYQSMGAVLRELEACLEGRPLEATVPLAPAAEEPLTSFLSFLSDRSPLTAQPAPVVEQTLDLSVLQGDSGTFVVSSDMARADTVLLARPAYRVVRRGPSGKVWAIGGAVLLLLMLLSTQTNRHRSVAPPQPVPSAIETPTSATAAVGPAIPQKSESPRPAPPPIIVSAEANYQLMFNGIDSYVQVPSLQYEPGGAYTCEAWFTLLPGSEAVSDPIVWTGSRWLAIWQVDRKFGLGVTGGWPSRIAGSVRPAPLYVPIHVAGMWVGEQQKLYVNGREVPLNPVKAQTYLPTHGGLFLGGAPEENLHHHRWYHGRIDEVRISRGLRYRSMFEPLKRFPDDDPDTLALYHCDEGTGERLVDSSGNDHYGQAVNVRWPRVLFAP